MGAGTNPIWTPLIAIAKAVVTDVGSVLCHATIVSREYNIPCIVATKKATEIIKDGDLIEVNANQEIVVKI